jgi:hypothetical protein
MSSNVSGREDHGSVTRSETVTIAALMAFDTYPDRDNDPEWLLESCNAATFALTLEDLPYGGWTSQGHAFECAAMVTVPVDSPEAQSAITNSEPRS